MTNSIIRKVQQITAAGALLTAINVAQAETPVELRMDPNWTEVSTNVFKAELPNGTIMTHSFGIEGMHAAIDELTERQAQTARNGNQKALDDLNAQIDDIRAELADAEQAVQTKSGMAMYTCGIMWSLSTNHGFSNPSYYSVSSTGNYYPAGGFGGFAVVSASTVSQVTGTSGQMVTDYDFFSSFGHPSAPFMLNTFVSTPTWSGMWYSSASLSYRGARCNAFEFISQSGNI